MVIQLVYCGEDSGYTNLAYCGTGSGTTQLVKYGAARLSQFD